MELKYLLRKNWLFGIVKIFLTFILLLCICFKNRNAIYSADQFDFFLDSQEENKREFTLTIFSRSVGVGKDFGVELYEGFMNAISKHNEVEYIPCVFDSSDRTVYMDLDYFNDSFKTKYAEGFLAPKDSKQDMYAGYTRLGSYKKSIVKALPMTMQASFDDRKDLVVLTNHLEKLSSSLMFNSLFEAHFLVSNHVEDQEVEAIMADVLREFDDVAKEVSYEYDFMYRFENVTQYQRDANVDDYLDKSLHQNIIYVLTNLVVTFVILGSFVYLNKEFIYVSLLESKGKFCVLLECFAYCLFVNAITMFLLGKAQYDILKMNLTMPYRVPVLCMVAVSCIDFVVLLIYVMRIRRCDVLAYVKMMEVN